MSNTPKGKVRLITFQSKEVLNELKTSKVYYADDTKKRENRDYSLDRNNLKGHQPVWCFKVPEPVEADKWYNGSFLFNYSCEMSLLHRTLKDFEMLELLVDENLPIVGLTHNNYQYSVVLPYLKAEWITMHYEFKERFLIDEIGSPVRMWILNHSFEMDIEYNIITPMLRDHFHILSMEEYDEVEHMVSTEFPLKAINRAGHVDNEVVYDYHKGKITRPEFLRIAGV